MRRGPRQISKFRKKHDKSVSLCMIVKNEAETLERCLSHARPYVDEIVIVDTGSTDGTREIARRYADVYDEIEWPGSFSVARNHSFDLATGDYILVLDGDEYIEDAAHWKRMHKALVRDDLAAVLFPIRNLLREGHIVAADRMWQERLMRNDPSIRYEGKVHNQIVDPIRDYMERTGQRAIRLEVEVIHTGYSYAPERMKEKYQGRIQLLEDEYLNPRSNVLRAYYGYQLGVAYFVLGRLEDALGVLGEIDYGSLNALNAFYARLLAAQSAIKLERPAVALVHCNHMLTLDRSEPVAYYTTGLALVQSRKVTDGMLMLLEAYNVNDAAGVDIRFVLNTGQLLKTLSDICGQIGLRDHERAFRTMLESGAHDPALAKRLIATLMSGLAVAEQQAA